MSPIRTAFVFFAMPVGGAEDWAITMARSLPSMGIQPSFVCLRSLGPLGEELLQQGAEVTLLEDVAPGKRWNQRGMKKFAAWLKEREIQIVHSQTYHAHTYSGPAARLAGAHHVVHQQKTLEKMPFHRHWTMKFLCRRASAVLALSEKTKWDLEKTFRLKGDRVHVVPNAVDQTEFYPASIEEKARLRQELHLPGVDEGPLMASIASLHPVKNHELTVKMLAEVRQRGIPLRVLFLGEGKELESLQMLAKNLGVSDAVIWAGRKRPVAPWIRAVDLVGHPSHWEGQPMALLQARACELPIFASEIEGNIATLGENHPGLFPPNDLAAYTEKVLQALLNPSNRIQVIESQNAQSMPWGKEVAAQLNGIYRQILA